jgi:cell division protein FtsX
VTSTTTVATTPAPAAPVAPTTTTSTPPEEGPDIVAWLEPGAPVATLTVTIGAWDGVAAVHLVSGEGALDEFTELFADRPELAAGLPAEALPTSLRIDLDHPSHLGEVSGRLRSLSDIGDVATAVTPECNAFPGWSVVVFADDDRQLTRLRNTLLEIDGLTDIAAVGRAEAHAEFLARFGAAGTAYTVAVQDMLVSLRARSSNPVALTEAKTAFHGDDAVRGVHVAIPGAPACS